MQARAPASVASLGFWRAFITTMRPYLMFISGAAGMVGLALGGVTEPVVFAVSSVVFLVSYGFGQAITDVFQVDTDTLSAPERPLVRHAVRRRDVLIAALAGFALCGVWLAMLNPWTLAVAALAVAGLLLYTPVKRRWWAGPAWNAAIVALLPVIGFLCGGGSPLRAASEPRLLLTMSVTLLTYMVFVLLGELKDVEADRATGYDTVAVHFSRRAAVAHSLVCAVAGVALSWGLVSAAVPGAQLLWVAGAVVLIGAHAPAWYVTDDAKAHPAITASVVGFVALHLGIVAAVIPKVTAAAWALTVLSVIALLLRPTRRQV